MIATNNMYISKSKTSLAFSIFSAWTYDSMNAEPKKLTTACTKKISREYLTNVSLPIRVFSGLAWRECECRGDGGGELGGGLEGVGGVRKPCIIQCVSQYKASPAGYITRPVINNAGNQLSESCVPTTMATIMDVMPVKTSHRRFIPCLVLGEFKSIFDSFILHIAHISAANKFVQ